MPRFALGVRRSKVRAGREEKTDAGKVYVLGTVVVVVVVGVARSRGRQKVASVGRSS